MAFDDEKKRPARKPAGGAKKQDSSARGKATGKPFGDKKQGKPFGKPFAKGAGKPAFKSERPKTGDRPAAREAATENTGLEPERISKLLARAGVASRRDVERMILEGRIRLNGEVLTGPAVNATYADNIEVDGVRVRGPERTRLWLYHKPAGLVTTNADPEGRPTVFDNLPEGLPRVMSIGRLDINTEGLLLLTNDGGLARVLELPTTGWLRRYRVRAHGAVDQAKLDQLKDGIAVDGVLYGGIDATLDREQGHNVWITMGLREGKNREIKNVLGAIGLDVNRLIRISYGPFQLGNLGEGEVMEIRGRMLRDQLGPRLIEEAKANFDAPIFDHRGELVAEEEDARPARRPREGQRPERPERHERSGRDDRPQRGERPFAGKPARDDRRDRDDDRPVKKVPPRNMRSANVWMAPGARPLGEKEAAKAAKRNARGPRPDERKAESSGFDRASRPAVVKVRDEEGQWIRSSGDDGAKRGKGFGDRRRDDRPRSDRPRDERSRDDRPRGERSFAARGEEGREARGSRDAARPARGFSGKPRTDRASDDRAGGERPFSDRPKGKSFGKPGGGKSFGGKPGGGKSFGGKPGGGKSFGGKPSGGRPGGTRSGGPRGNKPKG